MPDATGAALPPEDPPGDSCGFEGLRVIPWRADSVTGRTPSSGVAVFPTMIAPASRSRRMCALSWSATQSPNARVPWLVARPSVADSRSLMPIGTPHSGRGSPGATASASASARSAHSRTNAPRCGFAASMRASEASTSCAM